MAPTLYSAKAASNGKPTVKTTVTDGRVKKQIKTPKLRDEKEDHFSNLPPELRNAIYEYALTDGDKLVRVPSPEPGILRASKQIRREASAMYYAAHDFEVRMTTGQFDKLVAWLEQLVHRCGKKPLRGLAVSFKFASWEDIDGACDLVWLYYETGFRAAQPTIALPSWSERQAPHPKFLPFHVSRGPLYLQGALEKAVKIGRQARKENWSEQRVEEWLKEWVRQWYYSKGAKATRTKAIYAERVKKAKAMRAGGSQNHLDTAQS